MLVRENRKRAYWIAYYRDESRSLLRCPYIRRLRHYFGTCMTRCRESIDCALCRRIFFHILIRLVP